MVQKRAKSVDSFQNQRTWYLLPATRYGVEVDRLGGNLLIFLVESLAYLLGEVHVVGTSLCIATTG
jgi:hypothetical protein